MFLLCKVTCVTINLAKCGGFTMKQEVTTYFYFYYVDEMYAQVLNVIYATTEVIIQLPCPSSPSETNYLYD